MNFNDTTNLDGLIQACEDHTGLGNGSISGNAIMLKRFTRLLNNAEDELVSVVLRTQDEWDFDDPTNTDYPIALTNLVADQQNYTLPASLDVLQIKRVEIKYGTSWANAQSLDINDLGIASDSTTIDGRFSTLEPYFDTQNNSLFLYPIPTANVTDGLKIWFTRNRSKYANSDTTKVPSLDRPFHDLIAMKASLKYAVNKGLGNKADLKFLVDQGTEELSRHYGKKNKQRKYGVTPEFIDVE